jgi:hypothetical protein
MCAPCAAGAALSVATLCCVWSGGNSRNKKTLEGRSRSSSLGQTSRTRCSAGLRSRVPKQNQTLFWCPATELKPNPYRYRKITSTTCLFVCIPCALSPLPTPVSCAQPFHHTHHTINSAFMMTETQHARSTASPFQHAAASSALQDAHDGRLSDQPVEEDVSDGLRFSRCAK